ncbi:MAG TPA: CHASE4 domain-containing protein, partial [Alphaproteobacteria bacterium]|nr:CHASE4 domain-containing protein [Alphaproteobacteria bacterium]
MNIKLKIAAITTVFGICIIISALLLANYIIIPRFASIENSIVEKNMIRVSDALIDKMIAVDSTTNDYAVWDETYYAILEQNDEYGETGITFGSLERTGIDFGILIRNDGKIIFGKNIFNTETQYGTPSESESTIYSFIEQNYQSIMCLNESSHYNGFMQLPDGLAIISARPILKSDETGPIVGTLVFGKIMDEEFIQNIVEQIHISADIYNNNSPEYAQYMQSEHIITETNDLDWGPEEEEVHIEITHLDEKNILAATLLRDIFGEPVAILETQEQREIYLEGKNSVRYIIQAMIIATIIFILLQYWFFNEFIISRLLSIEKQIIDIHSKPSHSRIAIRGDDELSAFGKAINDSLDLIENSSREKQIILEANPNTYLYLNSALKIEDYKITGNIKETLDKKKITDLRNVSLSEIFNFDIVNMLVKAREEARYNCRPSKDMHMC